MYTHTQHGYLTIPVLIAVLLAIVVLHAAGHAAVAGLWIVLPTVAVVGFVFGSLTTEVDHERFTFWFGPGVLRHAYLLSEIHSCTAVTNPWWYGWGIHYTPEGWLYNVAGAGAVQITLRSGRRFRVGSEEPDSLCRAIQAMRGAA